MRAVGSNEVRRLVREALEEALGPKVSRVACVSPRPFVGTHPSHLEVIAECGEEELSPRKPCLIEPHRLCSNSGYCKKLGY